jgi:nucleotide sugar dehydrogenase
MNIGIIGLGFVGQAINNFFNKKNNINVIIYDKYKSINCFIDILDTDILYICLPTLYNEVLSTYDMTEIDPTMQKLAESNYKGIVLIKSTILPNYCTAINSKYNRLSIVHNPEFLSAKTAAEDFVNQSHIILGYTTQSFQSVNYIKDFYAIYFPKATISVVKAEEAGLTKLACNSFYATKIQYFTELYLLCGKMNISYDNVKNLMLKNNWINPMHTSIPGHDNMISFGGACFPKDISALNQYMIKLDTPNNLVDSVIKERNTMRD